jgi:methylenetetrahydrofolate reductase (NADPH)
MAKTKLALALASGRLAVTAECRPPRDGDAAAVKKLSATLPPNLDAVVVADNPDTIHGSALACAAILAAEGHSTVLAMVTRDRNRIALESDALGAMTLGVGGILSLSGDHQSLGACPQAAGVYDIDSVQFVQALNRMRREGVSLDGWLVGAAAHPSLEPIELNLLRLKKKVAAGADFVLTQAVVDLAGFRRWMDAVREAGLDKQVAIIAGVAAAGGGEMAAQLKSVPGVRGIHVFSGGCESLVAGVIQQAGLA